MHSYGTQSLIDLLVAYSLLLNDSITFRFNFLPLIDVCNYRHIMKRRALYIPNKRGGSTYP